MDELTSGVLSGIALDAIKKGIKISADYLKKTLSNWILDDEKLEEISKSMNDISDTFLENRIEEHLNSQEKLLDILKEVKPTTSQTIKENFGIAIGTNNAPITINTYPNCNEEKPREIAGEKFSLIDSRPKLNSIQIVKSFDITRDQCVVEDGMEPSVYAEIMIPMKVKKSEDRPFSMILFSYTPSENWINYVDAGYRMKFLMETSDNIRQVQLQIKNLSQQQFFDISLQKGIFDHAMKDIANRESWKDVREICFVVFANDNYITGENGFIRIKGLRLEK